MRPPSILAAAVAMIAASASAAPQGAVATAARSAVVALQSPAPALLAAAPGPRYVEIDVDGYHPAADGPVEVVVETLGAGAPVEIGRFGVYPDRPLDRSAGKLQRFRLNVPEGLHLGRDARLQVRLQPAAGTGKGASVSIRSAKLSGPQG